MCGMRSTLVYYLIFPSAALCTGLNPGTWFQPGPINCAPILDDELSSNITFKVFVIISPQTFRFGPKKKKIQKILQTVSDFLTYFLYFRHSKWNPPNRTKIQSKRLSSIEFGNRTKSNSLKRKKNQTRSIFELVICVKQAMKIHN